MYDIQRLSNIITSIEAERKSNPEFESIIKLADIDCEFIVNPKFLKFFPKDRVYNSDFVQNKTFLTGGIYFVVDDLIDIKYLPDDAFVFSIGFDPTSPINYRYRSIVLDNIIDEDKPLALRLLLS